MLIAKSVVSDNLPAKKQEYLGFLGFDALMSGRGFLDALVTDFGTITCFWSSTENSEESNEQDAYMYTECLLDGGLVAIMSLEKNQAAVSVRCIKE